MTQTTEIGGYEILAELKSGGMGDVFVARRLGAHGFAKLVALKTIRRDRVDKEGVRAMFLDEAKLVARLDHPAIAQVHDFGDQDGTLYLAMEYVAGLSFDEIALNADPPMPPSVAVRAMVEVCRGLHAAHEAVDLDGEPLGVVHRDVSPQNLMLTFDGRIKILDFGIARAVDRVGPETQTGTLKGKPAYMSPEQMATSKVDRRADVFSASIVLYELLTGEPLFAADNIFALADKVRGARIPPPSQKVEMPQGLDDAVLRGLARDPDGRYPSAAAMADALETVANAADAESLGAYAERAMVEARTNHRRFLHDLVTNEGATAPTPALAADGRAPDVATLAATANTLLREPKDTNEALAAAGLRRRRWLAWSASLVALAALGGGGLWLTDRWPGTADIEPPAVEPPVTPTVAVEPEPTPVEPAAVEPAKEKKKAKRKKRKRAARGKQPAKAKAVETDSSPPPTPTEFGFLKVTATPYANVRIDGRLVGPTPLMRHRLPVGDHDIELIDPETGVTRLARKVNVKEDQLSNLDAK